MMMSGRRRAGLTLAATWGAVVQIARDQWRVASEQTADTSYTVTRHTNLDGETVYDCTCSDYGYRRLKCKHIHAVLDWQVAEEYVISLFLAGQADKIEAWLERRGTACRAPTGWLDAEARDKRRVVWHAYCCVAERARAMNYERKAA
ncbi:MAG: SWIM zinc finger family protein [Anaerolineales bacterium]|nr:SWIM zinc finger family protein [Anaerolineales bacterium]